MEDKKIAKISSIKSRIKKVLSEQGNYSRDMDFLIEITAGNMYAYYLILRDVEGLTSTTVIEKTRENNDKKQTDPSIKALKEQSEMVLKCLRELKLTLSTVEGGGDDEMENLIDEVNGIQ